MTTKHKQPKQTTSASRQQMEQRTDDKAKGQKHMKHTAADYQSISRRQRTEHKRKDRAQAEAKQMTK